VQQFFAKTNIPVIKQPPYSPDLAPSDFWLFPNLKCFATTVDTKLNVTTKLWKIPKEAFYQCFQQWQDQWSKCMCMQGSYFESD
jgi:hypothetical protein